MKANRELVAQYINKLKADPNDSVTFNALVSETQDELVSKAKYMIGPQGNEDLAYDLVNDAWLRVIENNLITNINSSFMNLMEQIIRNELADVHSPNKNTVQKRVYGQFESIPEAENKNGEILEIEFTEEDALMHDVPDREREIIRAERDEIVHEILDQLEGDEADLLRLHYIDKYTQAQIAQILGVSQPTVGNRLKKAEDKAKTLAVKAEKNHDIDLHKISSVAPLPLFISMYSGWLEDMARFPKNVVPELYKQFFSSSVAGAAAGTMAVTGNTAAQPGTYTRIPKYDGSPAPSASASTGTAAQPGTYTRIPKYDGSPAPSASAPTGTAAQTTAPAYSGQAAPATAQTPAATGTSAAPGYPSAGSGSYSAPAQPAYYQAGSSTAQAPTAAASSAAAKTAGAATATSGTGKIIAATIAATLIIGGGGGYIAGNALGVFDNNKDTTISEQTSAAEKPDGQLVWVLEDGLEIDSIDEIEFSFATENFSNALLNNSGYPSCFTVDDSWTQIQYEYDLYTGNAISAKQGSNYGILDYSGNILYPFSLPALEPFIYDFRSGKGRFKDSCSPIFTNWYKFGAETDGTLDYESYKDFSLDFTSLSEPSSVSPFGGGMYFFCIQNNEFHIILGEGVAGYDYNPSAISGAVVVVDTLPETPDIAMVNYNWDKHTIGFGIVEDGNIVAQFDGMPVIYTNGFIMYEQNGKYGFVNGSTGQKITEAVYDDAKYFVEDYAPVKKDEKWAYIDSTGKQVTDFVFEDASTPYEGRVFVKVNGTYKILDLDATIKNGTYITSELLES